MTKRSIISFFFALILVILGVARAGETVKIGVIHLLDHPDHAQMRQGFLDGMKAKGYTVDYTTFNADSPQYPEEYVQRGSDEARKMVEGGAQLLFTTGMYHAVKDGAGQTPVIDAAFLSPLIMKNAEMKSGKMYSTGNAAGTYLSYPFEEIVKFGKAVFPEAKKIAYVYNPNSPVSRPVGDIEAEAKKVGLEVVAIPFTSKEEALAALDKAKAGAPYAFITNDIAIVGAQKEAVDYGKQNKYPIILGILPAVNDGALASFQFDWYRAGEMCAEKADAVLKGQKASEIPMEKSDKFLMGFNAKTAESLGITVPYEWIETASVVAE